MPAKKPHMIIFNPDQFRADYAGHLGFPLDTTPCLDHFVREEGVSFSRAFCQNPVCTPSRCSFMSGWYPHVRGHRTMHHMLHAELGEPNLLRTLKENGYHVWWGGKNDLIPKQNGFERDCDEHFKPSEADYRRWGFRPQTSSHGGDLSWRGEPEGDNFYSFFKGKLDPEGDPVFGDSDWARVMGAVDRIRSYEGEKPLCLYLPIDYPHPPYCVEDPWFSLIDRDKLPHRIHPSDSEDKPRILDGLRNLQGMQGWPEERWNELRAVYAGMCARIDHQFGMVVDALKERGMFEDSAVFFFSDHGDFTGDYGLVEKTQNTFEDCLTRVPFAFKPPANRPVRPGVRDALVELVDFSATVFDLAGIEPGYDSFGKSLLPLAAGKTDTHRDAVFCEGGRRQGETQAMEADSANVHLDEGLYAPRMKMQALEEPIAHGKAAMCRTSRYKYVQRLYETDELYDLEQDPGEESNRVEEPEYAVIREELRQRLLQWYMETCDVVPYSKDTR